MSKTIAIIAAVAITSTAAIAHAQQQYQTGNPAVPIGTWEQHHSSTAYEGALRGWAHVIDAQGRYNYNTSQAMIFAEEAKSKAYANHTQKIASYFEGREINRNYRQAERRSRPVTAEAAARYSRARAPERLDSSRLEPVFGTIQWPVALVSAEFTAERSQLDELFRDRDSQTRIARDVKTLTAAMQQELKEKQTEMPVSEYMTAKKFLRSLAYEATQAPRIDGVASR